MRADRAAVIAFCEQEAKACENPTGWAQPDRDGWIKDRAEMFRQIVAALGAAPWQPISSAPKDGTQIWTWDEERGSNPSMWLDSGVWVVTYDDALIQPTHWMPLPGAPL